MKELRELAALFLRLGTTSFGGPAVHIAMMEEEVVRRRQWLTAPEFLDLVGASQMIPGPNSTELAIHIGYKRAGWCGLLVAGASFILPAMAIVWAIAWSYVRYGALPAVGGLLAGVKPVVIAIVLVALLRLGRTALHSAMTATIFAASVLLLWFRINELVVLAFAALIALVDRRATVGGDKWRGLVALGLPPSAVGFSLAAMTPTTLFLVFLKCGALLFGSGYVLFAFLQADLVDRLGWLTQSQLIDAVAVGQFTPGPLFTTATFVGYLVAGNVGALVATLGIFLPAFAFVALTAPVLARYRANADVRATLDGVNAASLALMAGVTYELAGNSFFPIRSAVVPLALFLAAVAVLVRTRLNPGWLVAAGALVGLAMSSLPG